MTKNPNLITEVNISFFKPNGYEDTHYVDTDDRMVAINTVTALYALELTFVNHINARYTDRSRVLNPNRIIKPATSIQERAKEWTVDCFGRRIADDPVERNQRFLEEAVELVQSLGATETECQEIVSYVFNREVGRPHQEVGGVMVTLAALCNAHGIEMIPEAVTEMNRIDHPAVKEKIRLKQMTKPRFGVSGIVPA